MHLPCTLTLLLFSSAVYGQRITVISSGDALLTLQRYRRDFDLILRNIQPDNVSISPLFWLDGLIWLWDGGPDAAAIHIEIVPFGIPALHIPCGN